MSEQLEAPTISIEDYKVSFDEVLKASKYKILVDGKDYGTYYAYTEGLEYENISEKECSVSGIGTATSYINLIIPTENGEYIVKEIGDYAFNKNRTIKYLIIPESVTTIGAYSFYFCQNLVDIIIGNNVTNIGGYSFYACTGLTNIEIPNSVTNIGDSAFMECELISITIGNSVTDIGNGAFEDCKNLKNIIIPESVTNMGYNVFYGCDNLTIFCEVASKPYGWDNTWNKSTWHKPTYWKQSEATYNGRTYKLYKSDDLNRTLSTDDNRISWDEAKQCCEDLGGHLATITSQEEQNAIKSLLTSELYKAWLGGYYENSQWKWVTGETWNYTNWDNGQPDYAGGTENKLGTFTVNGTWNGYNNSSEDVYAFIVEFDS